MGGPRRNSFAWREDFELLDDFDRQGSSIKPRQGSLELCFAEQEARLFIRGLIRGRERVLAISRSQEE